MGCVLFSSFENLEEYFYQQWSDTPSGDGGGGEGGVNDDIRILFPSLLAMSAGGVSGCVHGFSYTAWDAVGSHLFQPPSHINTSVASPVSLHVHHTTIKKEATSASFRKILSGTMLSHTLVHGALFGSYELTKRSALVLIGLNTERDTSRVEGE